MRRDGSRLQRPAKLVEELNQEPQGDETRCPSPIHRNGGECMLPWFHFRPQEDNGQRPLAGDLMEFKTQCGSQFVDRNDGLWHPWQRDRSAIQGLVHMVVYGSEEECCKRSGRQEGIKSLTRIINPCQNHTVPQLLQIIMTLTSWKLAMKK